MILGAILLTVIFAAGGFFWAWWAVPRDRVPPHLTKEDLDRLETEDRLRQTSYQMLAGGALVFTFCLTVYQSATSYNQWFSDYTLRIRQAEVTHLSEALKALSLETNPAARVAGYYSLRQLVLQYPEEALLTTGVLTHSIRSIANERDPFTKSSASVECGGAEEGATVRRDREDADPEVQVAMNILGEEKLASQRALRFKRHGWLTSKATGCLVPAGSTSLSTINLSHLALDNLDLNGADFSCLDMTQSRFRRTNFRDASLEGANFGGSTFDDWATYGFLHTIDSAEPDKTGTKRAEWLYSKEQGWRRYRCWIADFRGANLSHAVFSGAGLAGADFGGANLTETQFGGADISRANFRGATVTPEQLSKACADEQPLHDFSISIKHC